MTFRENHILLNERSDYMIIKRLKLDFWLFMTDFLLKFTFRTQKFQQIQLKLTSKCQEKGIKEFKNLFGYDPLNETQR